MSCSRAEPLPDPSLSHTHARAQPHLTVSFTYICTSLPTQFNRTSTHYHHKPLTHFSPYCAHTHTYTAVLWALCLMLDDKQVCVNVSLALHLPAVCLGLSAPLCHYCLAASICPVCVFSADERPSVRFVQYQCPAEALQPIPPPKKHSAFEEQSFVLRFTSANEISQSILNSLSGTKPFPWWG